MSKHQGKVAVVTGGSSGSGLAAAELFAIEGAHVFIMGRRKAGRAEEEGLSMSATRKSPMISPHESRRSKP